MTNKFHSGGIVKPDTQYNGWVADETITNLWDGLARECHEISPDGKASGLFLETTRRHFLHMLANYPERVLSCATIPAGGDGRPFLAIVISDGFRQDVVLRAKRFYKSTVN